MPVVHFNHAGAGIPAPETLQAIIDQLHLEAQFGPMEAAAMAASQLAAVYDRAARLLNAGPEDIVFGTGHGQLFGDIVSTIPLEAGDKILASRQEWMGNLACLQNVAKLSGASVSVMVSDESTAVDVDALKQALTPDVRIVALTWIGASGALINPAAAIGKAIRDSGANAFYIIDASQALGQIPIDVKELGCDALVACGRKYLRGPRGTALAFISPRLAAAAVPRKIDNFSIAWNSQHSTPIRKPKAFDAGEASAALKLGLGKAIELALQHGVSNTRTTLDETASQLRAALNAVPGVRILDLGQEKSACVTFVLGGVPCDAVKESLARRGIAIGMNGRAYTPCDLDLREIPELLRASVHLSTTQQDIGKFIDAIAAIASSGKTQEWTPK
ncbi:aminotransferase class V-fold PLP-dependent enzyme [Rhizobium sp. SL42]|uniref:aminotransferase class V-fold PLP-dependent enzyme n=1 Tax=Rhizobium sp. SL42 TaxID=2806346 RepID=UPI001F2B69AD|nr:aminotransferase class V-fold PLP-dependent enzyme [Rhizobium sp. SL42]UJW73807.1 aminotransferase class V-fold PLP-dependent enzyme [Rhizobium sp. SL42]